MGDIIIRSSDGNELRFTHDDFATNGKPDIVGRLNIPFSKEWQTMTGNYQIDVAHTSPEETEREEQTVGGHNAHFGDITGTVGLFASTKNRKAASNEMLLPGGKSLQITHEWGAHGSIEGQTVIKQEQLTSTVAAEKSHGGFFSDLLGKKK